MDISTPEKLGYNYTGSVLESVALSEHGKDGPGSI